MMKSCFLGLFVLLSLSVYAQNAGIYIVDYQDKIPVQYAVVENIEQSFRRLSDENGFVPVNNVVNTVRISSIGYESKRVDLSDLDLSVRPVIYLTKKVVDLSEVTIQAGTQRGIFKTISDLDIHLRPINNSQEVMRMVPGLFIGQHAGGGKAEQIFLRGFDIDHGTDINVTVDGMPVNMVSHAHGQGYADLHFVIPELIEDVNFNKGPYFADKGDFTTAGYVAFKTKTYLENNFVKLEAGQFETCRGIFGVNLLKNKENRRKHSLYLAGEGSFTDGYFEHPQDFSRFNGMLKYHGEITSKTSLTASLSAFTSRWDASGQIPDRAVENGQTGFFGAIDSDEGGKTSRHNANLSLLTNLDNGGVLRNNLYFSLYDFELYSNFTFFKEDSINGDQIRQKENRDLFGYDGSYFQTGKLAGIDVETRAGVQFRYDAVHNIELTRTAHRTQNTDEIMFGDVNEWNAAAYLSGKFSFNPKFDVTIGLRYDYFNNQYNDKLLSEISDTHSSIVSPKLNFNYTLNDKVQFYLYNGRGFHSNDTRVAVAQNGRDVLPSAYGTDLGGIFKIGPKFFVQTALWHLWLAQEFVYVGDEGIVEAGGATRRTGVDLSARYEIVPSLFADVDMTYTHPRALDVPSNEHFIPLAPIFTSTGGLTYRKQTGFNGSLRYRYMGNRPANEDNSTVAEGYFVVDAALNYTHKTWEAGLSIQNLLNTKWKETQFDTESRLQGEPEPVSEIHFTPGVPFFARASLAWFF
jgi:outer membrane cobalamin receptor